MKVKIHIKYINAEIHLVIKYGKIKDLKLSWLQFKYVVF